MKFKVDETSAGQTIGAKLVFRPNGNLVATVQSWHGGFTTHVNVFNFMPDNPSKDCEGRASGGGYDKYVAALRGCQIDGYTLADHCGEKFENGKYKTAGLDYLVELGYRVVTAI